MSLNVYPKIFQTAPGPDWSEYLEALKTVDKAWRQSNISQPAIGVFGKRPSWQDTIARAEFLFDSEDWAALDEDQLALIAPSHFLAGGDALLGSIGRRSPDVRHFLLDIDTAEERSAVLGQLKAVREGSDAYVAASAGAVLAQLCAIRGIGRAFATRLLALARPDWFVVVNNRSVSWLRSVSGMKLAGKKRSYQDLISWVSAQAWHQSPCPADPWERSIWKMRAALLDAFAYEPGSD
jgi:hypothetical protein